MRSVVLGLLLISTALSAQPIVNSNGPSSVAVTLYRGGGTGEEGLDLDALGGYALITETREVDLPPGVVTIRFEGVSSGIEPASALVTGVPVAEKNRDRRLLSQRGLLDAFTGQAVTIRRTNKATGRVTEETGTIRSAPDNLILQTKDGYEAVHCTGLDQTLLFPSVPADLTAKPTLSVTTTDQPGGIQTIRLSYLADGFDWRANYVAELADDASHINLLGWLTMASSDLTTYGDATASAVAGRVFHGAQVDGTDDDDVYAGESFSQEDNLYSEDEIDISYHCWPAATTTSHSRLKEVPSPVVMAPPPPAVAGMLMDRLEEAIVVTAERRAQREDLGDLKLYRIPFAVTVAARSQKQVAFLSKTAVKGQMIYRTRLEQIDDLDDEPDVPVELLYRVENTRKSGLGEPLPSGQVAVFQTVAGSRMLVGEAGVEDKAVGEEVDVILGEGSNVTVAADSTERSGEHWQEINLKASNANPFPITYEAEFPNDNEDFSFDKFGERMGNRHGKRIWRTTVPANGSRSLTFRVMEPEQ